MMCTLERLRSGCTSVQSEDWSVHAVGQASFSVDNTQMA